MSTYQWIPGWRPGNKADAQTIGDALEAIRVRHGKLTARIVVAEARKKRSPLHSVVFHIPAESAAERYYEERARKIIQAVVRIEERVEAPMVRAFPMVVGLEGREYVPALTAALTPEFREQIHDRLVAKLSALRAELQGWDEFAAVVAAIDEVAHAV